MEIKIKSTTSAMPENASKATLLEIEEASAAATDVFQILTNYPKIKKVRIGGTEYKREQVGKLGLGDRLGAGTARRNGWDELENILVGDGQLRPAFPAAAPQRVWDPANARWVNATPGQPAPIAPQANMGGYEEFLRRARVNGRWVQAPQAALPADILGGYVEPEPLTADMIGGMFGDVAPTATAQEAGEEEAPW